MEPPSISPPHAPTTDTATGVPRPARKIAKRRFRYEDPYREAWLALTPSQRFRRSWRLRKKLRDLQAVHDAKTFPELGRSAAMLAPAPPTLQHTSVRRTR